ATCAPLNPTYRAAEFDVRLRALRPKALLVPSWVDTPARSVALQQGFPILELAPLTNGTCAFGIFGAEHQLAGPGDLAEPDDIALVLQTSGTTAVPALV